MQDQHTTHVTAKSISQKLKSDITITAPGWAFAVAALAALVLLGVALD